jgi:hypothetical protein
LFSLLRTLLSRQDLRNILDKVPSLPTISVAPLSVRSVLSRDRIPYSRDGIDRETLDGLDPIHVYNKSFEDRYHEKESSGRAFLSSSMDEKGRWQAPSERDSVGKATAYRNGNGKLSPQEFTRSIMKDHRCQQRNAKGETVDLVSSKSQQGLVLTSPVQTLPGKLDSNVSRGILYLVDRPSLTGRCLTLCLYHVKASQTASVLSEYALSLDSRQRIAPAKQTSVSFEGTRLRAPPVSMAQYR